jgi:hypothetical protein
MNEWLREIEELVKSQDEYINGDYELKENINYMTINLCSISVFRVYYIGDTIEVAKRFLPLLSIECLPLDESWIRISLDENIITNIINRIGLIFTKSINESTKEPFGCCNSFNLCSDQKKCIHTNDDKLYRGCMYRENLKAGRIFYGKNRNI